MWRPEQLGVDMTTVWIGGLTILELKVKAAAVRGHKFGIQIVGFKV